MGAEGLTRHTRVYTTLREDTIDIMETFWTVVLVTLATIRVTRFIVVDRLTDAPRQWLVNKYGTDSLFTYLWFCPWCVGFWVSLIASSILWWAGGLDAYVTLPWWVGVPAVSFALSYLTGWVLSKEDN